MSDPLSLSQRSVLKSQLVPWRVNPAEATILKTDVVESIKRDAIIRTPSMAFSDRDISFTEVSDFLFLFSLFVSISGFI